MSSDEAKTFLEKLSKTKLPLGRLPTMEECIGAIRHPETAPPWIKEYVQNRPEIGKLVRAIEGLA